LELNMPENRRRDGVEYFRNVVNVEQRRNGARRCATKRGVQET
jgi:hypothetical protein